jgi:hypothetical protein
MKQKMSNQEPPASILKNELHLVKTMQQMQIDALILLKFLAGRSDKSVQLGCSPKKTETNDNTEERDKFLKILSSVLAMPPEKLAADTEKVAFLFDAIDHLACLAYPATIESIKFTDAYTGLSLSNISTNNKGFKLTKIFLEKFIYILIALCTVVILGVSIMLMAHVVSGQKIMQTLQVFRQEQDDLLSRMTETLIPIQAQFKQNNYYDNLCERKSDNEKYFNEAQANLCHRYDDLNKRMSLTYIGLQAWNVRSEAYADNSIIKILQVSENDIWNRTELNTEITINQFSVYIIPMLLGFIGAAAYIFRSLSTNIRQYTLKPNESFQAVLRILLGSMLGSLVCLAFNGGGVTVSELNFSLGLIAFLAGYAVQVAFNMLDWVVIFLSRQLKNVDSV